MRKLVLLSFIGIFAVLSFSCSSKKGTMTEKNDQKAEIKPVEASAGPQLIIYKTNQDYFDKVPVTLSEDRSRIVSYPGTKDIYYKGEFSYPTRLIHGFLMDNRGINRYSAFLEYTYEEYSKLEQTPAADELFNKILEDDPFTEIYSCGSRFDYKDPVSEINAIIESNELDQLNNIK
jgi:hypothetical protein